MGGQLDRVREDVVNGAAAALGRVAAAPDQRRPELLDAVGVRERLDEPGEPGGVTRDYPDGIRPVGRVVVATGVEGDVDRPGVLTALEQRRDVVLGIQLEVRLADARRAGVDHDVRLGDQLVDQAGELDPFLGEPVGPLLDGGIERVAVVDGAAGLEVGPGLGHADQRHVRLGRYRVGDTFPDGPVAVDRDPNHT